MILPKEHVPPILDSLALDSELLCSMGQAIQNVAQGLGLDQTGFRVQANAVTLGLPPIRTGI